MTRLEKIREASLEELADIIFDLDGTFMDLTEILMESESEHEICSRCEYHDIHEGCMNYDHWTNGACDPHGVCDHKEKIKRWLMEEL